MISNQDKKLILEDKYHIDNFLCVCENLLPDFVQDRRDIKVDSKLFDSVAQLGSSKDCDITILEVVLKENTERRRVAITQEMFKILRDFQFNNAFVSFVNTDNCNFRISLLTSKYEWQGDNLVKMVSNPRRYSYSLGYNTKTKTAHDNLIGKGKVSNLHDLLDRFSVEVVNKEFYNKIALQFTKLVGGNRDGKPYDRLLNIHSVVDKQKVAEFAVRLIGRIVFCWFLKAKKSNNDLPLVTDDMLSHEAVTSNANYYHSVLEPLFFEILNTKIDERQDKFANEKIYMQIPYLNGGLFSPHNDDHYQYDKNSQAGKLGVITIPDSWFNKLYDILNDYNFTVDENTSYDIELSIDPEMLGRIFENLLAEINPETGESAKKSTGSFYTPRDIVDYMVDSSIFEYLKDKTNIDDDTLRIIINYNKDEKVVSNLSHKEKKQIVDALYDMTTLDPACGSGAFPIGLLQKIVYIYKEIDPDAKLWFDKATQGITNHFIKQEFEKKLNKNSLEYILKLSVIQNSIFGIDIQPIAVEISRLRCFLSLIIEEKIDDNEPNRGIEPLPNLDFKFVIANTLIGLSNESQSSMFEDHSHIDKLKSIREKYFNASPENRKDLKYEFVNVQKAMLQKMLSFNGDATKVGGQQYASKRYRQLQDWNPFENQSTDWFDSEWMFGIQGFDIVIANPPYVHLEKLDDKRKLELIGKPQKKSKSQHYKTYEPRGDLYCLFYEMGIKSLKQKGILTYITSNKWMRAGYGNSLRNYFVTETNPIKLIDLGSGRFLSATVDTNIFITQKSENEHKLKGTSYAGYSLENMSDYIRQNEVEVDYQVDDIWTILNPIEQSIKNKMETIGTPLKNWDIKINRGILTGCNEAFIINDTQRDEILANCKDENERKRTAEIIRPILRGRDIKRFSYQFAGLYVILAYFGSYKIIPTQYPSIYNHLKQYETQLQNRGQCRYTANGKANMKHNIEYIGQHHWLELDNNPRKEYMDDFSQLKIIYSETNNVDETKITLDGEKYYTDKTCFILVGKNDEITKHIFEFMSSDIFTWYMRLTSPLLGECGISLTKISVETFPIPPLNKNYGLTLEETKFISSCVKSSVL